MSIGTVGVVGTGLMGSGIIEAVATAGLSVVAVKATNGDVGKARARVTKSLDRRVDKGKLTADERDAILSRITFTNELEDLAECEIVIETALEDATAKTELLRRIEEVVTPSTIVATNTSSLPLEELARGLARPEELVALHFFNPVPAMKLVELASTAHTAPGATQAARAFIQQIGKTPVEVAPTPGYVVNRLLVPYILHAIETLEIGVGDAFAIDQAMQLGAAHPMGPLALADLIGLDVVLAMARTLHRELNDSRYRAPSILRRLVLAGHLGKKTGRGIFDYTGEATTVNGAIDLRRPMVTAAAAE